jgi:hypothetical protein
MASSESTTRGNELQMLREEEQALGHLQVRGKVEETGKKEKEGPESVGPGERHRFWVFFFNFGILPFFNNNIYLICPKNRIKQKYY